MKILERMAANKHTSAAAVVGFMTQAVPIFWPELQPKCDAIFKLAIIYGFASAKDAMRPNGSDTTPPAACNPPCSPRKNQLRLWVLIGASCAALLQVTGCGAIQKNPAAAQRIADHVAYDVATVLMEQHPEWRPPFQRAHDDLVFLEMQPTFDAIAVIEILQRIPARALQTTSSRIVIDGATLIIEILGDPALKPVGQETLRTVVKGLHQGLYRRLAEPDFVKVPQRSTLPPAPIYPE